MQAWKADPQFSCFHYVILCVFVCVYVWEKESEGEPVTACSWRFTEERIILISCHVFEASYFFCTVYFSLRGPWTSAKSLVFDSQSCSRSTGIIGVCHCVHLFKGGFEDLIEVARLVLPAMSSPCPWIHSFSWWSITPPHPPHLFI